MIKKIILLAAVIIASLQVDAQTSYSRVQINCDRAGMQRLASLGIAVDHGERRPGSWIRTDLSDQEIAIARANGFEVEVLIEDVSAWYVAQNLQPPPIRTKADRSLCNQPGFYPLPQNFSTGSMGGFYTWEEMLDVLDAMHAAYPELISPKQPIGTSHEGRPLHFVRISNDPLVDQDKPEVLYDALHHAREPASLHQLITYMWYLLERYGSDPEVTYLMDNMEMYFVPCVNPDGYVYNATNSPNGGGMWRKNRRDNGDGTFGVDLNRNYGQGWGYDNFGSSPDPSSDVYRGPSAFSEPETQAMRDFCNAHEFRLALNYHTYGDLLVYPWSYLPSFYTPDSAIFVNHSDLLTDENRYRFGTADQTVNYVTNGDSDDWMYGEQDTKPMILSMTPEAGAGGEGFWPPQWRIPEICQDNIGQNLRTAHLAGKFALAYDHSPPVIEPAEPFILFALQRQGVEPGPFTVSIEPLENVVSTGNAVVLENMDMLETRLDSIQITVDPTLTDGERFTYVIAIDNGSYTYRDTITKIFGVPLVLFADDASTLNNWDNIGWSVSAEDAYAGTSFSDSPGGNYVNNSNLRLTLQDPIDLTTATGAILNFHAKWDLEAFYDHVQVLGSSNGTSWTPLCGKYTRTGSQFQDENEPVYDGQQPNWTREEIGLDQFLGGMLHLRFRLLADMGANYDGFHLDDISVTATGMGPSGIGPTDAINVLAAQPNPATAQTWITYEMADQGTGAELLLFDAVGSLVKRIGLNGARGSFALNTSELNAGIYNYTVTADGRMAPLKKLVVIH